MILPRSILGFSDSVNGDKLINVSRKVLAMLMSRTSRLDVETLVELTGHGTQYVS